MKPVRDAYCSYCGSQYSEAGAYPRTCASCTAQVWANPIPVAVALVPVVWKGRTGLLVIRRAIPPVGRLALVGGFLEEHESWRAGAAREVHEETGAIIDAATLTPFWFASSEPTPNRVLLFGAAAPIDGSSLAPFTPDAETSERGLVFGPDGLDDVFAFALHAEAARRWFAMEQLAGPHGYVPV